MSQIPKWSIRVEEIRGVYVFLVLRGRSSEGSGSADDLDTCIDMAKEAYWDCRKYRNEMPLEETNGTHKP